MAIEGWVVDEEPFDAVESRCPACQRVWDAAGITEGACPSGDCVTYTCAGCGDAIGSAGPVTCRACGDLTWWQRQRYRVLMWWINWRQK